jgi:hypothetical protein
VVTAKDVATFFRFSARSASTLCSKWVKTGFLSIDNPSTKSRSYRLADAFESLVAEQAGETAPAKERTRKYGKKK